ncbi:MAG: bifunctional methylenetetrahydrofolate dehydrogenase/methenyltetrahydrofolate cyclohydrolase FolD [Planctomycetota bacterium]
MNTIIISGKEAAAALNRETIARCATLPHPPCLTAVLVGADAAAKFYASSQERSAKKLGLGYLLLELPSSTSQSQLHAELTRLSSDDAVAGIILLTPLPSGLSLNQAREYIDPRKDVEGITPEALGKLAMGMDTCVAPTAKAAYLLAKDALGVLSGVECLVAGYSDTVGKPLAFLLLNDRATVTVARSKVRDLPALIERAELVFACMGKPHFIKGEQLRPGSTVIDVGTNEVKVPQPDGTTKTAWVGDVDTESAIGIASAITPVPGGVGTLTTAVLFNNLVQAAERQQGRGK